MTNERRPLTEDELFILGLIQDAYGSENTEDEVFFSDRDEAVIFVQGDSESGGLGIAVLTNLAKSLADGTISSVEELKREWLLINDT